MCSGCVLFLGRIDLSLHEILAVPFLASHVISTGYLVFFPESLHAWLRLSQTQTSKDAYDNELFEKPTFSSHALTSSSEVAAYQHTCAQYLTNIKFKSF